jgi:hypothetical protein
MRLRVLALVQVLQLANCLPIVDPGESCSLLSKSGGS